MPSSNGMTILPPDMDGRPFHPTNPGTHNPTPPLEWPQNTPLDAHRDPTPSRGLERLSTSNLRTAFRTTVSSHNTIRAVTPEFSSREESAHANAHAHTHAHHAHNHHDHASAVPALPARTQLGSTSPQSSPRSIPRPGDMARRQGVVFNDTFGASYDSNSSSPPPPRQTSGSFRPRTHTMDGAFRQQYAAASSAEGRHRVGSFSSSGSQAVFDDNRPPPPLPIESMGYPSISQTRPPEIITTTGKEKKGSSRRLIKRQSSRPTSPQITVPSVDSLPIPVPTDDANKVLLLMKTLCGRMRGEIEFQTDPSSPWQNGIGYIDEEKGSLMFDSGRNGPFHNTLIQDLRGCRITPMDFAQPERRCLQILSTSPNQVSVELLIHPTLADERDLWLAALLCWQQLRPPKVKLSNGSTNTTPTSVRPPLRSRGSDGAAPKSTNFIKVGQVRLWDKGLATSPRAIVKRPSTRDLRSQTISWRLVSCLLQENGEIRLTTNDGDSVIAVVELSQLSRCAIQQLHKSVLDEEYCIAIFPHYSTISTQLSIFRPVYMAFENRLLFEVWFVLLRAFALPDIYRLDSPGTEQVLEIVDLEADWPGEIFRVEKTITVRVTEAKLKQKLGSPELPPHDRHSKTESDPLVGNYLAEVILDGEVRARTPLKSGTKNPYWREEYQFIDLPAALPFLSIILKRVDGNLDMLYPQLQPSANVSKIGNLSEALCGAVDIPLDLIDSGKDLERWFEVLDVRQHIVGTMLVKVHYEELVVLHSNEYQALSNLLHSFPSGLTTQIAHALPGQLRKLSEIFLNIFQVSGQANDWLQTLVEDEIDGVGSQAQMTKYRFSSRLKSNESLESASDREQLVRETGKSLAGEANLLFRGNTLFTQALEFHMRRSGKEYLETILQAKISEINEMNPNCEVDPSKLKPGEDLAQNWNRLLQAATEVWQCIAKEPTKCPSELRSILKYVRAVAEDRYGDWLRTVTYTSVSGFLFLRFICPAILSPKLFGLLRDHPRPRAQRTFTLIAKALQALGNLSTFGKKEEWMEPMNKFLTAQRQSVREYIDAICAIPVERNKVALGPSYSTPITILGRLSPNAREGFPALPFVIDHARNFAALIKLWADVNPFANLGSKIPHANGGGEDDVLIFNDMCLDLQRRTDICHARMEEYRAIEGGPHPVSELADVLEQSTLDAINQSCSTPTQAMPSPDSYGYRSDAGLRPPRSAGSDVAPDASQPSRRSKEHRRGREMSNPPRHASAQSEVTFATNISSGGGGTLKRNGGSRSTRTILSGIMKPFARSDSPEHASPTTRSGKSQERTKHHGN
ncbi:hypothetical protein VDGE_00094 [Verticillium dahliae]|uniref:Ras-GAP domain-containing protein n=1 Tax=Verticillium dahliae TaxID=27337 RepID=A0A444S1Z8_VERDA|nr:hypothetical protein VDGE_00094 [Verticillium dahliae]